MEDQKARTEIIEWQVLDASHPFKSWQIRRRSEKALKNNMPATKIKKKSRAMDNVHDPTPEHQDSTVEMSYAKFLDEMPDDIWKVLPHTLASVISEGKWKPFKYLVLLSHILAAIIAQGGGRVLISLPPRHGKSWFVSQWLIVWFLTNWSDLKVILATYEARFAATWGRRVRNIIQANEALLGLKLSDDSTAAENWELVTGGGMITAGVGGPITGKGGNLIICFPAGTLVRLANGNDIKIEDIKDHLVLSYDHDCDTLAACKVTCTRRSYDNRFIELTTSSGNKIRATRQHHIYDCQSGYKPACDFRPGDWVYTLAQKQGMLDLWPREKDQGFNAPGMLRQGAQNNGDCKMLMVWRDIRQAVVRVSETVQGWADGFLLFRNMQSAASCYQTQPSLSHMRQNPDQSSQDILYKNVSSHKSDGASCVRTLWSTFYAKIDEAYVLFSKMRRQGTFCTYDWFRKFALSWSNELFRLFSADTSVDYSQGWGRVCGMWMRRTSERNDQRTDQVEFGCASHRSRPKEQSTGKSNHIMRYLPSTATQIKEQEIVSVTELCNEGEYVYDIRVEKSRNFFADGILVHNCDDPHKNWQEAMSETIREMVKDWFDSTLYTRAEPGATIVVLHTRWHEDDLIGYLIREKRTDGWIHIRIPAISEEFVVDGLVEPDPLDRKPGEALCPERYDLAALRRIKENMSSMMWAALFQQRPAPMEGNIFLREHWRYYDPQIPPRCNFIVQSWDTASSKHLDSARTICQTWGISDRGIILLDRWGDKVQYPQLRQMVDIQYHRYRPNVILVEDKDTGRALVQDLQQGTTYPVIPVTPLVDKVIRATAITPAQQSGRLLIPDPTVKECPVWVAEFIEDCCLFPNGMYKDDVDAMSQAITYILSMAGIGGIRRAIPRKTTALLENYRMMM